MRALLIAVLLAGCQSVVVEPDTASSDWAAAATPFGAGHDHTNSGHHSGLTTPNFHTLASLPITSAHYGGRVAGGYLCGDAQRTHDGRTIAAVESRSDVGFAVMDLTDPAAPFVLGELVMETTYIYDLTVVPDGRHVALVTSGTRGGPLAAMDSDGRMASGPMDGSQHERGPPAPGASAGGDITMRWESPCGVTTMRFQDQLAGLPWAMNILLVDISEPTDPQIVDVQPLAGYGHSILPYRMDQRDLLLVTTATGGSARPASGYFLYEVLGTPAGARLSLLSAHKPTGDPVEGRTHDGWIAKHPGGKTIAYLAGGDDLTLLDLGDPRAPVVVGSWRQPVADGFLHGAFPLPELLDGRHYTVVGPEYCVHPENTPTGVAWVLDTTDPADIFPVAAWTLPHEVEWDGCYMFSNHYFTVIGRTLFMSMYHGGIWAIDLTGLPDVVDLPSVGVFLPDHYSEPAAEPFRWAPTIEEAIAVGDTLVTFDSNHGLYTLQYDEERPMTPPEPWPVEI